MRLQLLFSFSIFQVNKIVIFLPKIYVWNMVSTFFPTNLIGKRDWDFLLFSLCKLDAIAIAIATYFFFTIFIADAIAICFCSQFWKGDAKAIFICHKFTC